MLGFTPSGIYLWTFRNTNIVCVCPRIVNSLFSIVIFYHEAEDAK